MAHPSPLETIVFFDLFDWPLTQNELFKLARGTAPYSRFIEQEGGFIFLKGRERLVKERWRKEKQAASLWRKTRRFISFLAVFPFVRAIFVSNTLAYNNAKAGTDIDLFIVIRQGQLWFSRFLISLWLLLLGEKRQGKRIADKFCLNFFVTEETLDLSKVQIPGGDPYLDYWLFTLSPVFDYGVLPRLVSANSWLKERFPWYGRSVYSPPLTRVSSATRAPQFLGELIFYLLLGPLWEQLLRVLQLARIRSKQKSLPPAEVASDSMLKFHPQDKREAIRKTLQNKMKKYAI